MTGLHRITAVEHAHDKREHVTGAGNRRRAFTLVEVLMVLALIVILGVLALPSIERPMAAQSLRSGVDEVRTSLIQARIAAMNTGQTYVFLFSPGADHYTVQCQVAPELASDLEVVASATGEGAQDPAMLYAQDRHLPKDICFGAGQSFADSRAQTAATNDMASSAVASDPQLSWNDAIFFYPDGTTSTAVLRVQNQFGRMIELSLRGLTGVATVSGIQDAPPGSATGPATGTSGGVGG